MATVRQTPGSPTMNTVANGDTYIVEGAGQNQVITTGTDFSSLTEGLERAEFRLGANVQFTPDAPLRCDFDSSAGSMLLFAQSGGSLYYWPKGDNNLCNRLKHIGGGAVHAISGGTITENEQSSGYYRISASVIATNIYNDGGSLVVEYNSTAFTGGVLSGNCVIERSWSGTVKVCGANAMVRIGRRLATDTQVTGGTLEVTGGMVTYAGGNITNLYLYGDGEFDFKGNQDITITNLYATKKALERSNFRNGQYKVTVTNPYLKGCEIDTFSP